MKLLFVLQNYSFFMRKQKIASCFTNIYANFALACCIHTASHPKKIHQKDKKNNDKER